MWKTTARIGLIAGCIIAGFSAHATADTSSTQPAATTEAVAGSVKTLKGEAFVIRAGQTVSPEIGMRLHPQDVLRTGKNGSMGIVLRDDTAMSIGPSSELTLKEFVFRPKDGVYSMITRFVKGTLVYITGRIAKLSPSSVNVETPVGIIAVRGTKFMVKSTD